MFGACDCDVQSAFAAVGEERPESVRQVASHVLAVADRDQDGVALVALDPLEVLHEEPLGAVEDRVEVVVEQKKRAALVLASEQVAQLRRLDDPRR